MEQHPKALFEAAISEFLGIDLKTTTDLVNRSDLKITEYYGKGKGFSVKYHCKSITEDEQKLLDKVVKAVEGLSTNMFIPKDMSIDMNKSFEDNVKTFIEKFFEADDCLLHDDGTRDRRVYETWKFAKFLKHKQESIDTPEYKLVDTLEKHIEQFISYIVNDDNTKDFDFARLSKIRYSVECLSYNDYVTKFLKSTLGSISYTDFVMLKNAKRTVSWILRQKGIESKTQASFPYILFVDAPENPKKGASLKRLQDEARKNLLKRKDLTILLAIATEAKNGGEVIDSILKGYFENNITSLNEFILNNIFMLFYSGSFSKCFFEYAEKNGKQIFSEQVIKRAFDEFKHKAFSYTVLQHEVKWIMIYFRNYTTATCFDKFAVENHVYVEKPEDPIYMTDKTTGIVTMFETLKDAQLYYAYVDKFQDVASDRVFNDFRNEDMEESLQYFNDYDEKRLQELRKEFPHETELKLFKQSNYDALAATHEYMKKFIPKVIEKTERLPPSEKLYHLYYGAQLSQHNFANNQLLLRILKDFDHGTYLKRHYNINILEFFKANEEWGTLESN